MKRVEGAHYYSHDALYNVTAIVNASGSVLERYQYSPYGTTTVLDANFANDVGNTSDIGNTHFYTGREIDTERKNGSELFSILPSWPQVLWTDV